MRSIYFLPVVVSAVATGTIAAWLFNDNYGVINAILVRLGIGRVAWLSTPQWALPSLAIATLWVRIGFNMVVYLAALQSIPAMYYEAARIDGASALHQFRHITLPLLAPATFLLLVLDVIYSFQVFDLIYVMTGGGPGFSTTMVVQYIFNAAFVTSEMGYASAMGMVLYVLILSSPWCSGAPVGRRRTCFERTARCHCVSAMLRSGWCWRSARWRCCSRSTGCSPPPCARAPRYSRRWWRWCRRIDLGEFRRDLAALSGLQWAGTTRCSSRSFGVVITVFVNLLCGYTFAKFRFPGRNILFFAILGALMIPIQVILVPEFLIISWLGLLNTHWGVILPRAAEAFGIFMVRQFMVSIPDELIEAARLDGAGEFRIFLRVRAAAVEADHRGAGDLHLHVALERLRLAARRADRPVDVHAAARAQSGPRRGQSGMGSGDGAGARQPAAHAGDLRRVPAIPDPGHRQHRPEMIFSLRRSRYQGAYP